MDSRAKPKLFSIFYCNRFQKNLARLGKTCRHIKKEDVFGLAIEKRFYQPEDEFE